SEAASFASNNVPSPPRSRRIGMRVPSPVNRTAMDSAAGWRARMTTELSSAPWAPSTANGSRSTVFERECRNGDSALLGDSCRLDVIELREILGQIGVALSLCPALVRALATRRALTVAIVNLVDNVHAFGDFAKW